MRVGDGRKANTLTPVQGKAECLYPVHVTGKAVEWWWFLVSWIVGDFV